MSTIELLYQLTGINLSPFSREELIFLEAELFTRVCEKLKEIFKVQYKDYFLTMKFNTEMENEMMEKNYVRYIINDILSTEEYSLQGIAYYTLKPEDVIFEVAIGKNTDPSSSLVRKIIELHRSVRPDIYREIMKKITTEKPELKS